MLASYIEVTRGRKVPKSNSILHLLPSSSILIFFIHNFFIPLFLLLISVWRYKFCYLCVNFFSIYCIVYVIYILLWFVYVNNLINQITRKRHYINCVLRYIVFLWFFQYLYYAISCMCICYVRQRFFIQDNLRKKEKNWMEFSNQTYFKKEI